STSGGCLSACKTIPRADNGSFTPVDGGTSPSHNGDPGGGVTSTLNVATRRSTACTPQAMNVNHTAMQNINPQCEVQNPKFLPSFILPLLETRPLAVRIRLDSPSIFCR